MNKKILLIALLLGASLCSQQTWALTSKQVHDLARKGAKSAVPGDIIKNNTSDDISYTIKCRVPSKDIEGVVLANSQEQIETNSECPRSKITKIFFQEKMDEGLPSYFYLYQPRGFITNLDESFVKTKNRTITIEGPKPTTDSDGNVIEGAKPYYEIKVSQ